MRALLILAAVLAAGALPAPIASAQSGGSPFAPLPPSQPTPAPAPATPTPTTSNRNPNDEQLSTLGVLGLFVAGILVILVIGFFIMRDARKSLPRSKRRKKAKKQPASASASPSAKPGSAKRPPPPRRPSANARKRRKRQKRRTR